ncbi:MAG: hypothetical protein IPH41_17455 [Sulfuritalea sp.]|nr:hypothetical protein [Sulfuritalea sp.]
MLDASALDARREAAAEFLRQSVDLLAQEVGDLLCLDREDRLPGGSS